MHKAVAKMDLEFRKQSGRVMLTGKPSTGKQQPKPWNWEVLPKKSYNEKRRVYQTSHKWSWFLNLAHSPKSTSRVGMWNSARIFLTFSMQRKGAGNEIGLGFD